MTRAASSGKDEAGTEAAGGLGERNHPWSGPGSGQGATRARVAAATDWLERRGVLAGARSHRLSARIDPGLLRAAREKLGAGSDSELVTAALAVLAGGDDFGAWLVGQAGALPQDFELAF
ncbi:MAG: hypothetical protein H0X27_11600 [Caulobacteraceae bacterium]|nr:hypothetical protein [Caulobacteraceae bacterium]